MSSEELIFRIALGILPGIGDINARKLVDYIGSIEGVFKEPYRNLVLIPGIGSTLARKIIENRSLLRAEKELNFLCALTALCGFLCVFINACLGCMFMRIKR